MVIDRIIDQCSRALGFLIECFKMILEEPKLLIPSLLSVLFGFIMSLVIIVPFVFMGLLGKLGLYIFGGAVLTLLFVSYTFSYFFMGASSYAVYQHIKQGRSSLSDAFSRAVSCIVTLLLLAATGAVIQMIVNMLKNSSKNKGFLLNLIGSLAADVLREGWDIAVRLLVPVAVITGLGYMDSLKKAFEIVKNNVIIVGVGEISIRILTGIIGFFGVVLSIFAALGLFFVLSAFSFPVAIAIAVPVAFVCISLVSTLNLFIRTSYYTMLYVWAEERSVQGPDDGVAQAVPAPLHNAFGI
ncbi:DUF6159 family protein [Methanocella arvoryzae]|uniref:Uncharacterized protein n=1 Tax=Methanocella arvoryzae (strain DSM 22066 / NBRC 105507 / MRE50) TaxID=351160 RepID=Q0W2W7_METAR|nr:DUF6159 family protein [Methanocella arvoryzae]CAJ37276.1 hypothetical protein RCIX2149 [Methanocella arvoryzae MRE50]